MSPQESKNTDSTDDRTAKVRQCFDSVARRYDMANHVLSFGMDFQWRKTAVALARPCDGGRILDMCCGTGDLAFCFARQCPELETVVGCDISEEMLRAAEHKHTRLAEQGRIGCVNFEWMAGDCGLVEFGDKPFDIVSCGFGVRNVDDLSAVLARMHRVLSPDGRACILEFSLPGGFLLQWMYLAYLFCVLPILGALITGRLGPYVYLAKSVKKWARQVDLPKELLKAGFRGVEVKKLSFGVVSLYLANK